MASPWNAVCGDIYPVSEDEFDFRNPALELTARAMNAYKDGTDGARRPIFPDQHVIEIILGQHFSALPASVPSPLVRLIAAYAAPRFVYFTNTHQRHMSGQRQHAGQWLFRFDPQHEYVTTHTPTEARVERLCRLTSSTSSADGSSHRCHVFVTNSADGNVSVPALVIVSCDGTPVRCIIDPQRTGIQWLHRRSGSSSNATAVVTTVTTVRASSSASAPTPTPASASVRKRKATRADPSADNVDIDSTAVHPPTGWEWECAVDLRTCSAGTLPSALNSESLQRNVSVVPIAYTALTRPPPVIGVREPFFACVLHASGVHTLFLLSAAADAQAGHFPAFQRTFQSLMPPTASTVALSGADDKCWHRTAPLQLPAACGAPGAIVSWRHFVYVIPTFGLTAFRWNAHSDQWMSWRTLEPGSDPDDPGARSAHFFHSLFVIRNELYCFGGSVSEQPHAHGSGTDPERMKLYESDADTTAKSLLDTRYSDPALYRWRVRLRNPEFPWGQCAVVAYPAADADGSDEKCYLLSSRHHVRSLNVAELLAPNATTSEDCYRDASLWPASVWCMLPQTLVGRGPVGAAVLP